MNSTKKLTASALSIALATVLMWVSRLIPAPWMQGGSVTLASMVPIVLSGILFGTRWGLMTSLAYAIIQLIFGFYPPPVQNILSFVLVVMLDYILAFGVLGLGGTIYRLAGKKTFSVSLAAFAVTSLRYVCHIFSGVVIWGVYANEGQSVLAYSIIYNGSYMIPEIIITTVVATIIYKSNIIKEI